jgi:DNA recombination protein RmuC
MDLVLYGIITFLLVILAIIITMVVYRRIYQTRLLESSGKIKLLEDTSKKALQLEAEVRELLPFKTIAEEREKSLELARSDISHIQAELTAAVAESSGYKTQLEQQQSILEGTFKRMESDFQVLGQRMLDESSQKLNDRSKESLKTVLDPLAHDLGEFKKRIDATHDEETKQRTSLQEQVRMLADLNQKISKDAENLTRALKGDSKTQGTWGEMILEKVLEVSGLRKNEEYELQKSFTATDGKRLQPDVVIHLPEKRDVVVDAKVSLVAYDTFIRSGTDAERIAASMELASSIRTHIKGLSAKAYQNIDGIDSIDIVVMFIANEGALSIAVLSDRTLLEDAVRQNIMLATPTSLIAVLKGIEYGWRSERQNRNVQIIFKAAGDLYDKFTAFASDMEELGSRLEQAHRSYDSAKGKLISGRGNLTGRVEKLRELGAKNSKTLPSGWAGDPSTLEIMGGDPEGNEDDGKIGLP